MSVFDKVCKELELILGTDLFQSLCNSDAIKLTQLQALISILIKACIDFDLTFTCGTRRDATALALSIYINPTTTIQFVINLEAVSGAFSGSPEPT
ncbi:hypothetical protein V6C27_14480 [Peptococcaceae bacterium 1198_IL3148]